MSIDLSAALAARFKPVEKDTSPGVVIEITGLPGTGKTDLALRAPGPVIHFGFDYHGARRAASRLTSAYAEKMARVVTRTYPLSPRDRKREADDVASEQMRKEVLIPFLEDFEFAVENGVRSIVIDTLDLMKQAQVISRFGKLESNSQLAYGEINAETAKIIHTARQAEMVVVLITRMKEEYRPVTLPNGKKGSEATGRMVKSSNVATSHAVDAWIETLVDGREFKVRIVDAKTNKSANGMVLDSPEFAQVCNLLKPDVDYEAWE
jgi:RecA/RadA recombinase